MRLNLVWWLLLTLRLAMKAVSLPLVPVLLSGLFVAVGMTQPHSGSPSKVGEAVMRTYQAKTGVIVTTCTPESIDHLKDRLMLAHLPWSYWQWVKKAARSF